MTTEALTVALPALISVARPGLEVENDRTEVSLDVQVAELVTSLPPLAAVNCTVGFVAILKVVVLGPIVSVCEPLPVTLPVAEPLTPADVAVIVTLDTAATPCTFPALTVAHGLELCQNAEAVMSFEPLLNEAVAKSLMLDPCWTVKVLVPVPLAPVVTAMEFG